MDKFVFRTVRTFDSKYDYENVLAVIERIKSRCRSHEIRESFDRHPANAFDDMSLPNNDSEKYLHDDYLLFFDSAKNLTDINKSLSGKCGWGEIADIVDTQSGVGLNDWHWTLHTYQLREEYAQLLIDNLSELEKEIRANFEIFLSEERKKEAEREAIRQSIASIDTYEKSITDEGGKTKSYTHTIAFHDGEKLTFTERNIFDFGIVVNPSYRVAPGLEPGGLCLNRDGSEQWHDFVSGKGWVPVRELTKNEKTALEYLKLFGGFSKSCIRM